MKLLRRRQLATIQRLTLTPGDALVIIAPDDLTADQAARIRAQVLDRIHVPVLVFGGGTHLAVIRDNTASSNAVQQSAGKRP